MSQIILHPDDTPASSCCPPAVLPQSVRKFGKLPNVENWKPGDMILVSSVEPNFTQQAIRKVQTKGGYHYDHAQWHHAAIYLGDYGLCEATLSGVKAGKIYRYIGKYRIRVRRDPNLSDDCRWRIVVQALLRLNFSYRCRN